MPFYDSPSFRDRASAGLIRNTGSGVQQNTPCPVCGHPTGDCVGESEPPKIIAGYGATEELKEIQNILVEEDILQTVQITPFTSVKVILHAKGKYIPYKEAESLGLIKK